MTGTNLQEVRIDDIDDLPPKLRSLACVHQVVVFQMTNELALRLARRIEAAAVLTAQNAALTARSASDLHAAQIQFQLHDLSERHWTGIAASAQRLQRQLVALVALSLAAGFLLAWLFSRAGWL